jgi:hypothetical protein
MVMIIAQTGQHQQWKMQVLVLVYKGALALAKDLA